MKNNYRELKRKRLKETGSENIKPKLFSKLIYKIKLRYAFLFISILIFTVIYFYSYNYTVKPIDPESLPLIKRDPSYLRIVPEDKGGVIFSNQDKEIYNSITPQDSSSKPKIKSKTVAQSNKADQLQSGKMSDLITKIQNAKDALPEITPDQKESIIEPKKLKEEPNQIKLKPKEAEIVSQPSLEKNTSHKNDKRSLSSVFDVIEVGKNK